MDGGDWGNVLGVVLAFGILVFAAFYNGSGPDEGGFV